MARERTRDFSELRVLTEGVWRGLDKCLLWYPSTSNAEPGTRDRIVEAYWQDAMEKIRAQGVEIVQFTENKSDDPVPADPVQRLDYWVERARKDYPAACNHSTLSVARAFGIKEEGLQVNANNQAAYLMSENWIQLTPRQAQERADVGQLVIAALPANDPKDHGHTAIVMPQMGGRRVRPSGLVPDLYCPLVGGGAKNAYARAKHGSGTNWIFGARPRPDEAFEIAPVYYVKYFGQPKDDSNWTSL